MKIEVSEKINNVEMFDLIMHSISKDEVINEDLKGINCVLKSFRESQKPSNNKLMITFAGYEFDKREIYEIQEIRKYVRKIFDNNKDLFYYLTPIDNNNKIILACMGNFKTIKRNGNFSVAIGYQIDKELKSQIIDGVLIKTKNNIKEAKDLLRKVFNYKSEEELDANK